MKIKLMNLNRALKGFEGLNFKDKLDDNNKLIRIRQYIPGKISWEIARLTREIIKELEDFQKGVNIIIEKYSIKDEKEDKWIQEEVDSMTAEPIIDPKKKGTGIITNKLTDRKACNKEIQELYDVELDFDFEPININKIIKDEKDDKDKKNDLDLNFGDLNILYELGFFYDERDKKKEEDVKSNKKSE